MKNAKFQLRIGAKPDEVAMHQIKRLPGGDFVGSYRTRDGRHAMSKGVVAEDGETIVFDRWEPVASNEIEKFK